MIGSGRNAQLLGCSVKMEDISWHPIVKPISENAPAKILIELQSVFALMDSMDLPASSHLRTNAL